MDLAGLKGALDRGESGVEAIVELVVQLGAVTIPPTPDPRVIFTKLAQVVSNLSVVNAIQAQITMKAAKLKGSLAVESARYKVELDQARISHPECKSAPSIESKEIVARGLCVVTADKVANLKAEFAVYEGVEKVVSTTHQNLVTMKEALSKQVAILELEHAASVGTRPGIR